MKPVIVSHCEKCGKVEHIKLMRGMKTATCPRCGNKKSLYHAEHSPRFPEQTRHITEPHHFLVLILVLFLILAMVLAFIFF